MSHGWVSLLASTYQRRAEVLNWGLSGYNTRMVREVLPRLLGATAPSSSAAPITFATIFLGANDAVLDGMGGQHVPLDEFAANLDHLITELRAGLGPRVPLVLLAPPPTCLAMWTAYCTANGKPVSTRLNETTAKYAAAVVAAGARRGCPVLDLWSLLGGSEGEAAYAPFLCDGIHLTAAGNEAVFTGLMKLIEQQLPHLRPLDSTLPCPEPDYTDLMQSPRFK